MFTWLNKQGVRSDLGFEVQRTDRFSAEYRENEKIVKLYVESGGGQPSIIISPNAFERWSNGVPIPPEQQARMLQNFKEAMEFQGLKLLIE